MHPELHTKKLRERKLKMNLSKCALAECQRGINIYEAAVDMECTNVQCQHPKMMHLDCFREYELRLVDELSKQGKFHI